METEGDIELLEGIPSADFALDCSQEVEDEENDNEGGIAIFSRSHHLQTLNVDSSTSDHFLTNSGTSADSSEWLSHGIEPGNDLFVESLESTDNLAAEGLDCVEKEVKKEDKKLVSSGEERVEDEWSKFQTDFESLMAASEEQLAQEQQQAPDFSQLREELMMSVVASLSSCLTGDNSDNSSVAGRSSPVQDKSDSVSCQSDKHFKGHRTGSYAAMNGNAASHKHGSVLQSSRFEHLSESDLDRALEAIKEEGSREGSVSPNQLKASPSWESMSDPKTTNNTLMQQLQQLSLHHTPPPPPSGKRQSNTNPLPLQQQLFATGDDSVRGEPAAGGGKTVYLDVRPPQDTVSSDVDSAARRLLAMRMPLSKSSSEDSEDCSDPHQWQLERNRIKHSLSTATSPKMLPTPSSADESLPTLPSNLPTTTVQIAPDKPAPTDAIRSVPRPAPKRHTTKKKQTTAAVEPTVVHGGKAEKVGAAAAGGVVKKAGGGKGGGRRRRTSSSGSLSEDDVFVITEPCWDGDGSQRDPGSQSEEFSPGSPSQAGLTDKSHKKSKNKKKKKRKDSSGSDKGGENSSDSSPPTSRGKKGRGRRSRTDSLTQSSDDDIGIKFGSGSTTSLDCEEETPETRRLREEQMRADLQRKIESRKPPSVKNAPCTDPLFHQDASFRSVIPSTLPLQPPNALLLLSLFNFNNHRTRSSHTSSSVLSSLDLPILQELFSLLLVWLINLATDTPKAKNKAELWRPFVVSGLQQTTSSTSTPHVVVGVATVSNHDGDVPEALNQLLNTHTLARVLDPLLSLVTDNSHLQTFKSLAHLPLSSLLTVDDDPAPLSTPLSFYWLCLQREDSPLPLHCLKSTTPTQNTVCTIQHPYCTNTDLLYTIVMEVLKHGLDLAGIRVVYPTPASDLEKSGHFDPSLPDGNFLIGVAPTLALAVRGPQAISKMADAVGPEDISLARTVEPNSINARFSTQGVAVSIVHSQYWSSLELARWFGGRACVKTGAVLGVSDPTTKQEKRKRQRVRFSESEDGDTVVTPTLTPSDINLSFPPLVSNRPALVCMPYSKLVVVVSPLVPPSCYAALLRSLADQGLHIHGIKRLRLNSKRAQALNIPLSCIPQFTPASSNPPSPSIFPGAMLLTVTDQPLNSPSFPPLPSLLIAVGQENASSHKLAVSRQMFLDLKQFIQSDKHSNTLISSLTPDSLLHVANYNDDVLKAVGSFTFTPSTANGYKLAPSLLNGCGIQEELSVVAITAMCVDQLERAVGAVRCLMGMGLLALNRSSNENDGRKIIEENREQDEDSALELLGLKIVPELSRYQAKQLCPLPTTSNLYQDAMDKITTRPALLIVLRGLNSNRRVQTLLEDSNIIRPQLTPGLKSCEVILSRTLEEAFHLTSVFFIDKELFAYADSWALCGYTPPGWLGDCAVLSRLQNEPEPLVSVCLIDAERPRLLVKVLDKLSRSGFTVVGMSLLHSQQIQLEQEWALDQVSQVVAVCVQRLNAVWQLHHELKPFIDVYHKSLYYSPSFAAAVCDVQQFFPNGIQSHHPALVKYYQVTMAPTDNLNPFPASPLPDTFHHSNMSPLMEHTCLVLPPSHITSSSTTPFVMVLDSVVRAEFTITDIQLVRFSSNMAEELCSCLDTQLKAGEFSKGASLVVSLRRTNAASCFTRILTSSLQPLGMRAREDSIVVGELLKSALVPSTVKEAQSLLELLNWV